VSLTQSATGAGAVVIDADSHLFEPRTMWRDYIDPGDADRALSIEDDELGHAWLMHAGQRLHLAEIPRPNAVDEMGEKRRQVRAGERATVPYDAALPPYYSDPGSRVDHLDEMLVDVALAFPNYGLFWERHLAHDVRALTANMGAWNRWAVEVAGQGRGRLHPVGHVTLVDPAWLDRQLRHLSDGGVRAAMIAPALVGDRRLSAPELEGAWAAFAEYGIAPCFHVGAYPRPYDAAWYEQTHDPANPQPVNSVMAIALLAAAPMMAVTDLVLNGVLERHADLRVAVVELTSGWVPYLLKQMDEAFEFNRRINGRSATDLAERPSTYVRRQVRFSVSASEDPADLVERAGDLFMFSTDYPHSEGVTGVAQFAEETGLAQDDQRWAPLYGGVAEWLLSR